MSYTAGILLIESFLLFLEFELLYLTDIIKVDNCIFNAINIKEFNLDSYIDICRNNFKSMKRKISIIFIILMLFLNDIFY